MDLALDYQNHGGGGGGGGYRRTLFDIRLVQIGFYGYQI